VPVEGGGVGEEEQLAPLGLDASGGLAKEPNLAPLRPGEAGGDPEERRLPHPVGPEERHHLAGLHHKAHVPKHPVAGEALPDPGELDEGGHQTPKRAR